MNSKITFKKELCGLVLLLFALSVSFVMPNHVYAADSDFVVDENGVLTKYNGTGVMLLFQMKSMVLRLHL